MLKNYVSIFLLLLCVGFVSNSQAQQVLSKLEIKAKEVYTVNPDNILLVDTLIMHDKAVIQFNAGTPAFVGVNTAFVSRDCKFMLKGKNGLLKENDPESLEGKDGSSIEIDIHFEKLGSLFVDTRGGNGAKGVDGNYEVQSTKKTDADGSFKSLAPAKAAVAGGKGGKGGQGGNVSFAYSSNGFIPRFNQYRKQHAIIIVTQGGKGGKPGNMGKFEGPGGPNGQIKLINKNLKLDPSL
ncbi:hypothetical protein [Pontibacter arcticus]|uniref:Collagen-like protein n=1 Tax=Pontibacter arcticus TaxID=2080288 RepID=A0A364RBB7_9BACT|nr:hypothetical protein [Pontibacter arcticus]RAU81618.1 hypothetical protein DP923_12925 [Pontibacter arcticus]